MDGAEKEMAGKTKTWILVVALVGLGCSDADPKAACERWVESVNECTKEYILAIGAEWNDEERLRADEECADADDLALFESGSTTEELYHCQADILDNANCSDRVEYENIPALGLAMCSGL